MAEVVSGALIIAAVIVWVIAIVVMCVKALDGWYDHGWKVGLPWATAAILTLALTASIAIAMDDDEPAGLCLRGHQEYRTSRGYVPVGKVIVPTTSTSKAWICDQREQ